MKKKLFGVLAYGVFLVLLIEGTTRIFLAARGESPELYRNFSITRETKIMDPHPELLWKLRPSAIGQVVTSDFRLTYRTNRLGFREKELGENRGNRILFLGDSLTFGEGVEIGSRFSDLIGQELRDVETINTGVPGYEIQQMAATYRLYGRPLRPRLVLCAIIVGDIDRAIVNTAVAETPPQTASAPGERIADLLHRGWRRIESKLRYSAAFAYFSTHIQLALLKNRLEARDRAEWARILGSDAHGETWEEMRRQVAVEHFRYLKQMIDADGAKLLVVQIGGRTVPWLEPTLKDLAISFLDLATPLAKEKDIRFQIDPHYNAKGNRAIATLVEQHLETHYGYRR